MPVLSSHSKGKNGVSVAPQDSTDFWSSPAIVTSYQVDVPSLYWYEKHVVHFSAKALASTKAKLIHVVGCGPGRELPFIADTFPDARIIASDIASGMIDACNENLRKWGSYSNIELRCTPASLLSPSDGEADVILALNNVLTYITPESERRKTFLAFRSILRRGGILGGVVHNRWGAPGKSGYFALQLIGNALRLTSQPLGDCIGRSSGIPYHYYTDVELRALLEETQFTTLDNPNAPVPRSSHPKKVWQDPRRQ